MKDPTKNNDLPPARPGLLKAGRLLSSINKACLYLAGTGIVVMTVIVFWQVFCRYVLNWSQSWTEVTAVMLMSWFIFLGAAVGIRENYHLGFDVLLYVLPEGSKKTLRTLSDLVVIGFAIGMVIYGGQLVALSWPARMPSLGIPEGTKYLPVVGGGLLIILFAVERVVLRLAGENVDHDLLATDEIPTLDAVKEA